MARAGQSPDQGAGDAAAVQGETGQHVESGQEAVEQPQHEGQMADCGVIGQSEQREEDEAEANDERREWSDDGDPEFLAGPLGVLTNQGQAAEKKQGDRRDFHAVAPRHQRMRQLVNQEREKVDGAGGNAVQPAFGTAQPVE